MKFLVIGGAGYIGSHFIYEAIAEGHTCLAFDNLSTGHRELLHPQCAFVKGDLLDFVHLEQVLRDFEPDAIFHFAAFALVGESMTAPGKYFSNNVLGVHGLLEVIHKARKKPVLVFSSSCAVFGQPDKLPLSENDTKKPMNPYGKSKLMAEFLLEDYAFAHGISSVALRYFNACGAHSSGTIGEKHDPETHLISNVISSVMGGAPLKVVGNDFDTPDGTCIRDYIHVSDLAKGHLIAAQYLMAQPEGVKLQFHLGTGKGVSNLEVIREVEKQSKQSVPFSFEKRRLGDPAVLYSDCTQMKEVLKFQPSSSSLENIISTAMHWHGTSKFIELGKKKRGKTGKQETTASL